MRPVFLFGAGCFLVFVAAAATLVYGLGQYEQVWGRGGSFGVETWLSLVGALVAMGSFGIASAALRRVHAPRGAFVLGALCAVVYILLYWLATDTAASTGHWAAYIAFFMLVAISALASLAGHRAAA
jgi:hypothetical protein